jgi:hypothetical protein
VARGQRRDPPHPAQRSRRPRSSGVARGREIGKRGAGGGSGARRSRRQPSANTRRRERSAGRGGRRGPQAEGRSGGEGFSVAGRGPGSRSGPARAPSTVSPWGHQSSRLSRPSPFSPQAHQMVTRNGGWCHESVTRRPFLGLRRAPFRCSVFPAAGGLTRQLSQPRPAKADGFAVDGNGPRPPVFSSRFSGSAEPCRRRRAAGFQLDTVFSAGPARRCFAPDGRVFGREEQAALPCDSVLDPTATLVVDLRVWVQLLGPRDAGPRRRSAPGSDALRLLHPCLRRRRQAALGSADRREHGDPARSSGRPPASDLQTALPDHSTRDARGGERPHR